jgi:hypothetical protein
MSQAEANEHEGVIAAVVADHQSEFFTLRKSLIHTLKHGLDKRVLPAKHIRNMDLFKAGNFLSRNVLNKLAKQIFKGLPAAVRADRVKLADELDKRFSRECVLSSFPFVDSHRCMSMKR